MSNTEYPYRIHYPRTGDWWDGHWAELSEWCNRSFGAGIWNYYGDSFVFEQESHYMLFKLRWK